MPDENNESNEASERKLSPKDEHAAQIAEGDADELGESARRELLDPDR